MEKDSTEIFGILARFPDPETLIVASRRATEAGYCNLDAYTPFPVAGLADAMRLKPSKLPLAVLAGGIIGGALGYFMQYYAAAIDMPLNIGGRPLNSWPAFIPIAFEVTILLAALGGILGLFVVTRFPQPYHPVFNVKDFQKHGSQDGFYLGIEASDPKFDLTQTRKFLENLGAILVSEIEA
ncbi:MAG: DUF3341 domain-containing protein [Anaerolineaceae bacterium]|nr:DUF3341 domain-containing protein [Anaerolineaceae bacterium]